VSESWTVLRQGIPRQGEEQVMGLQLREAFERSIGRTTCHGRAWSAALVAAIVMLSGVGAATAAPAASASEGPAWQIMSSARPTHIRPGSPNDEVQDVTVTATGGTFTLTVRTPWCEGGELGETTAPIAYNASAAEVQSALEAMSCVIPSGNVTVSGGPGGPTPAPYVVTFTGWALSDKPIRLMEADGSALTGPGAAATVTEGTHGSRAAEIRVVATNVGGSATDGSTITLSDTLPPGVTAMSVSGFDALKSGLVEGTFSLGRASLSCAAPPAVSCTYSGKVTPGDTLVMSVTLEVQSTVSASLVNEASVSGGGAADASGAQAITASDSSAPFGPVPGSVLAAVSTNQAGAHPDVTTAFTMSTNEEGEAAGPLKDIRFDLPPGLVGNTVGMPRCTMARVLTLTSGEGRCPNDTMVGVATLTLTEPGGELFTLITPVYNIEPSPGEPAAFAFDAIILPVRLDTSVRSDGDYGVRVTAPDLNQVAGVLSSWITIWGVPADHSGPGEDKSLADVFKGTSFGGPQEQQTRTPLLTNPQQCSTPLSATMEADEWGAQTQGTFLSSGPLSMGLLTGCDQLSLESSFTMLPDTLEAGAPAGYTFDLNVPQRNEPDGLAVPNVKDVSLTLPAGTVVNPSAAWGLKACTDAQFGLHSGVPAQCPREAQVGTVRIKTPALEEALEGEVYLGTPECEPCSPQDAQDGRMVRLFVNVVGEGESGIVVKLEGQGHIDQSTGRITTVFKDNPQLPFDEFKLTLGGGPRAVLANPRTCGPVTTTMNLTPWSSPFTPSSEPFYTFDINQNCFGQAFAPSFTAGSTNIQAGEHSPFTLAFGRSDNEEFLNRLSLSMPPGLLGNLGAVTLCKEPQASQGTCGQDSLIGHVNVLTGPGADPFLVSGGGVYMTESYEGAPYGLSIVVPAVAGPYTLSGTTGKGTVVVRAKIMVDPIDAHLTVISDPLPTMLDGIPLQLKAVNVTIDKPDFTFNPTNCSKMAIGATLASVEGMSATAGSPFQVTNCATLSFKPQFKALTSGKTSRSNGASLQVRLSYPKAPWGSQANVRYVKVSLPKQLPSRLSTLQKACPDSTFNQNPAACPAASRVGSATATTPIIPVPLSGPAYFVSHGGAKFPELVIVLSGYGVTVQLHGETFISKRGITSSTFHQVPDVPIGSFQLTLPEGPTSALAANGRLCSHKLVMPTTFTAQNGMSIHRSTPIAVTGCAKHRARHHHHRAHARKHKQRKHNKK
jgi:hypothetical protein